MKIIIVLFYFYFNLEVRVDKLPIDYDQYKVLTNNKSEPNWFAFISIKYFISYFFNASAILKFDFTKAASNFLMLPQF
jgi:hypothetical protein